MQITKWKAGEWLIALPMCPNTHFRLLSYVRVQHGFFYIQPPTDRYICDERMLNCLQIILCRFWIASKKSFYILYPQPFYHFFHSDELFYQHKHFEKLRYYIVCLQHIDYINAQKKPPNVFYVKRLLIKVHEGLLSFFFKKLSHLISNQTLINSAVMRFNGGIAWESNPAETARASRRFWRPRLAPATHSIP